MKKLPRAQKDEAPYVPLGNVWNRAAAELERLGNIYSAGPGISVSSTPTGITISLNAAGIVTQARITAAETGADWYAGRRQSGFTSIADGSADASLPLFAVDDAPADDLLILSPGSGHSLPTTGNGSYGAVLVIGTTTESTPRMVGIWLGGSPTLVPVNLTYSGGADGDATTAATWTYTATLADGGASLAGGAALTVTMQRPNGKTTKAQHGTARYDGSNWAIWWCDEVPNDGVCPT